MHTKKECNLFQVHNWTQFFVSMYNDTIANLFVTTTTTIPVYGEQPDQTVLMQQIHQTYKVFQQKKFT